MVSPAILGGDLTVSRVRVIFRISMVVASVSRHIPYSRAEVARLLAWWPYLGQVRLPARSTVPPGYRGKHVVAHAPLLRDVELKADLEAAIARLPRLMMRAVYRRFWLGLRTHRSRAELIAAVHAAMNDVKTIVLS